MNESGIKILFVKKQKSDFSDTLACLKKIDSLVYNFEWSSSSDSAIQKIGERSYDVIFVSCFPGNFSGINLIRKIVEHDPSVSIIVVGESIDPETSRKAKASGAFDTLDRFQITPPGLERLMENSAERTAAKRKIIYMSNYDIPTGLPNRTFFQHKVEKIVKAHGNCILKAALLYIDIDNLKLINDSLGHGVGDQLIKLFAEKLQKCANSHSSKKEENEPIIMARLGSGDFAFFIPHLIHDTEAAEAATRIKKNLAPPFLIEGNEIFVTASIGISLYPKDGSSTDYMLSNANAAMNYTKRTWRNSYCFYRKTMNSQSARHYSMENSLRRALDRDELLLYFQPKFDIQTYNIVGMEALVRWNHPEKGLVPPSEFIPIAEETGLINPIGEWVIDKACRQLVSWHKSGVSPGAISVNISMKQWAWPLLTSKIAYTLSSLGLDPKYLELELTESIMDGREETLSVLHEFKEMGVKLAMDDFGTGYSSLSQLRRYPLDTIKIDRSFISNIDTSEEDAAIVSAIIVMAKCLNLEVIAEGVKNIEQVNFLSAKKCNGVQGFLFSRPVPIDNVSDLLALEKSGLRVAHTLNN